MTSGSRVAWFLGCRLVASQGGKTPQWGARTAPACLQARLIASFNFQLSVGLSLLVRSHGRRLQEAWCYFPPGHESKASGSLVARYMGVFFCIKHTQDRKVSRWMFFVVSNTLNLRVASIFLQAHIRDTISLEVNSPPLHARFRAVTDIRTRIRIRPFLHTVLSHY